jgi:hypothetical protein
MLFKFGYFWKSVLLILFAWLTYGLLGFEFATVTLLAVIVAFQVRSINF